MRARAIGRHESTVDLKTLGLGHYQFLLPELSRELPGRQDKEVLSIVFHDEERIGKVDEILLGASSYSGV